MGEKVKQKIQVAEIFNEPIRGQCSHNKAI